METFPARLMRATQFAARAHARQTRKGAAAEPYVNHVIEVAALLAEHGAPEAAILAGLLHDTVEDTEVTLAELEAAFGAEVASIVAEVTDDKTLPKETRKAHQVRHAATKSDGAKQVKLADKTSNLCAILASPPAGWEHGRRVEYIGWAGRVAAGLRGVNPGLEAAFDAAYRAALDALAREAASA
ncbi:MAG: HD domain-containing protein [Acetobacteraceae bacterium]|nr:HD domain-containing protein [Acetobacteraceae bacterium]